MVFATANEFTFFLSRRMRVNLKTNPDSVVFSTFNDTVTQRRILKVQDIFHELTSCSVGFGPS
jgi:hypothetical protein